jgi:hypothetical protein
MRIGAIGLVCGLLAGCGDAPMARLPSARLLADARMAEARPARVIPARVFVSGHSLVDLPYPEYLEEIAAALGHRLAWQREYQVGSSIKQRSLNGPPPQNIDAMIITEQHGVLNSLVWEDTARYLREAHDSHISTNPGADTWFFVPWLSMDDPATPARWMSYERAAAYVWQCTVSGINAELQAAGRSDQIHLLPASLALVFLVETLRQEGRATVFSDDVHLTPGGKFYLALVTAGFMAGGLQADALGGLDGVKGVTADQRQVFLRTARRFLADYRGLPELSARGCREFLAESFIDDYWNYYRDAVLVKNTAALKARWSAWRLQQQSTSRLLQGR